MLSLLLGFTYCCSPIEFVYEEPSDLSQVETQVGYATPVEVFAREGDYALIAAKGEWVEQDGLVERPTPYEPNACVRAHFAYAWREKAVFRRPVMIFTCRTKIRVIEEDERWATVELVDGSVAYMQKRDLIMNPQPLTEKEALELGLTFVGTPYVWGGRSSLGFDCSGLVKFLFEQRGITLPHCARLIAAMPSMVDVSMDDLQEGDLLFFGPSPGKITHIGIYLQQGKFLHAFGNSQVMTSSLDEPLWATKPTLFAKRYEGT